MEEALTRKEQREASKAKSEAFGKKMQTALNALSKSNAGILVLRFLMYECRFLAPLTKETLEGVNKDLLVENEALRRLYLYLRSYMDRETIIRVEIPEQTGGITKGEEDDN
jgi:hypothetical protein